MGYYSRQRYRQTTYRPNLDWPTQRRGLLKSATDTCQRSLRRKLRVFLIDVSLGRQGRNRVVDSAERRIDRTGIGFGIQRRIYCRRVRLERQR